MHSGGLIEFNKAAGSAYKSADKEALKLQSRPADDDSTTRILSTKTIMKEGGKIFKRIQMLVG